MAARRAASMTTWVSPGTAGPAPNSAIARATGRMPTGPCPRAGSNNTPE